MLQEDPTDTFLRYSLAMEMRAEEITRAARPTE